MRTLLLYATAAVVAAGLWSATASNAHAQWRTTVTTTYVPVTSYYYSPAPVLVAPPPVTVVPAPAVTTTYYAPPTVTTYYAPAVAVPAPVVASPVVTVARPARVFRPRIVYRY